MIKRTVADKRSLFDQCPRQPSASTEPIDPIRNAYTSVRKRVVALGPADTPDGRGSVPA